MFQVLVEALACATPVLTTRFGAAPEIVQDGVVGFVRSEEVDLVQALGRLSEIDRSACRRHVEERFSAERMVAKHVAVYREAAEAVSRSADDMRIPGAA